MMHGLSFATLVQACICCSDSGLNTHNPWLKDTEGALCFICEGDIENTDHFLLGCPQFKENFDSV